MVQILNDPNKGLGFGHSFGTGLSQGLQNLVTDKMQDMQQRRQKAKTAQGLKSLGLPEQLADLPEPLLNSIIKESLKPKGFGQQIAGLFGAETPVEQLLSNARGEGGQQQGQEGNQYQSNRNEGFLQSLPRHAARTASRLGEQVLGLPADIASFGLGLGSAATGGKIPSYEKIQESLPLGGLPTSSQLQKISEEATGGYTKPRSKTEENADELFGLAGSLFLPTIGQKGKLLQKGASALKKAAIGFGAGKLGKAAAKSAGFGETGQAIAGTAGKLGGLMLASGLGGRKMLEDLQKEKVDSLSTAAKDTITDGKHLVKEINKFDKLIDLEKTDATKLLKKVVIDPLKDNLNKNRGNLSLSDALTLEESINKNLRNIKISKPEIAEDAERLLNEGKKLITKSIEEGGSKIPGFKEIYEDAKRISNDLKEESDITKFIQKRLGDKGFRSMFMRHILRPSAEKLTAPIKYVELIQRSPEARKIYLDLMKGSAKQDAARVARDARKLDAIAYKYEQQNKQR